MGLTRRLTALFAAFEAALVVAIGIAIPLAPLTILWGAEYGFAADWTTFWRASVDFWLLGHGVDITVVLDPATAAALSVPAANAPVTLTIAALGFALLTVLLGARAGTRIAETGYLRIGLAISLAVFAALAFGVTLSTRHPSASPSLWQGTLLPTAVFAIGLAIGALRADGVRDASAGRLARWLESRPARARAIGSASLRGGVASAAGIMAAASAVTALAIAASYAKIITLYETLHTEVLGGVAVTLAQLAFIPNVVIFAASWLVGPGFSLGAGSSVTPIGTALGPIPAIPILGALPSGQLAFGFLGLLVPAVVGFVVGALLAPRLRKHLATRDLVATAIGIGIIGGLTLGLLAWASAGAVGPGRLAQVGPDPWAVGGFAALELAAAAVVGMLSARGPVGPGSRSPRR
jgi:hypothetical protein